MEDKIHFALQDVVGKFTKTIKNFIGNQIKKCLKIILLLMLMMF